MIKQFDATMLVIDESLLVCVVIVSVGVVEDWLC